MRSSTSSSDIVYPDHPWLKTWVLAVALAGTALLGWEAILRSQGHRPSVVDDKALWAGQRERVYSRNGEGVIVLLGECRMQSAVLPGLLQEQFPQVRVVQLAVEGTSPVATLRDLADDEDFRGIVVSSLNDRMLCTDMWATQQEYVEHYHANHTLDARLNRRIATAIQRRFTVIHPHLRLDDVLGHLARHRRLPAPYYMETHPDRSRLADYSREDLQEHREFIMSRLQESYTAIEMVSDSQWLQAALEIEASVQAIRARGGRVVFVRFPTSGEHLACDHRTFPRDRYWDQFAAGTSALSIHFEDVPELAAFECPDLSRLDRSDAPQFTLGLAKVLKDSGLFDPPAGRHGPSCSLVACASTAEESPTCRCPEDGCPTCCCRQDADNRQAATRHRSPKDS
jgi:hypothetical protein